MECKESDWKLFKSRVIEWQERYMEKLNSDYIKILQENAIASSKFWKLEERIKKDKKHPGVILDMRRSEMFYNIVCFLKDGVIMIDDLHGFSDELKERVKLYEH